MQIHFTNHPSGTLVCLKKEAIKPVFMRMPTQTEMNARLCISDGASVPHWSRQRVVRRCAFRPVYSQDSTCRWQDRTAGPAVPLVTDRTGSECTDRSVKQYAQYGAYVLHNTLYCLS